MTVVILVMIFLWFPCLVAVINLILGVRRELRLHQEFPFLPLIEKNFATENVSFKHAALKYVKVGRWRHALFRLLMILIIMICTQVI